MSFFDPQPVSKGGGAGTRTNPVIVQYDDHLRMLSGSYDFGGGTSSHAVGIIPMTEVIGPDTLVTNLELTEGVAGSYTLDALTLAANPFFTLAEGSGALGANPATTIFRVGGSGVELLRVESTLFPAANVYYLVCVLSLGTPGDISTIGAVIDFQVVFVEAQDISIISAAAVAGIDVDTLDRSLALAGHNLRIHSAAFIDGLISARTATGADRALNVTTTPELEDSTSAVGAGTLVNQTMTLTPDAMRNPSVDLSGDA